MTRFPHTRSRRPHAWVAGLACCTTLLAGCGNAGPGAAPAEDPSRALEPSTPATSPYDPQEDTMDAGLRAVVEAAIEDLESRPGTGAAPTRVVVARAETFPDGAVGCPRPGMMYTQALVEGYRVVLARGDRSWLYTAARGRAPRLCETDEPDGGSPVEEPTG